jgi:membrane protease subunit HflK
MPGGDRGGPRDEPPTRGPGDESLEILEDIWRRLVKWGLGKVIGIVVGIVAVIWLLTGIYIVGPGEVGVVRQFGREVGQTSPGLNYHIPWPIQRVDVVNMAQIRRAEIGFRTVEGEHERELEEALMLTGDENIADIQVLVQYRVKDASQFLFEVRDPERALHTATEVALRGVIGRTTIDDAMTVGRPLVEADTLSFLQRLLDDYRTGLQVVELKLLVVDPPDEVKDAFHEVVRALEDKDRLVREAEGYEEDLVPKARGNAEKEIKAAEAYKEERVLRAEGDAAKFLKVLEEYQKARVVTRDRLYLETIERVLAVTKKFIIDPQAGGGNLLQFLPLTEFEPEKATEPEEATGPEEEARE